MINVDLKEASSKSEVRSSVRDDVIIAGYEIQPAFNDKLSFATKELKLLNLAPKDDISTIK